MIAYLKQFFHSKNPGSDESTSLAIRSGKGGARLSHDHSKQYAYVLQSLTLWREILHGKTRYLEAQLRNHTIDAPCRHVSSVVARRARPPVRVHSISAGRYRSRTQSRSGCAVPLDTRKGSNLVSGAPKTSRMMHAILGRAQQSIGSWVGSAVVHLGDRDVPNALTFIGKLIASLYFFY
jgi:hypothetical protein